ncbi:MAG: D-2-hydroxyacid dehydrogenase family protein [Acidimicrobiia bacterium]|nr:D-2-hydroxyacid dehydrogenase family protein [Acidimicrobiia bacterium]
MRVVVLDDYQEVAVNCADWASLNCHITFLSKHLAERSQLVEALEGVDVVVAMRERTPFDADLFDSLPALNLLVTTGMRNAAIDLDAAERNGVVVCGTASPGHATAELTFALVQLLARGLHTEAESVRTGAWQVGLGSDLRGATLGLIGLGRLGSQVARFGAAFGMDVVAWSENLTEERASECGVLAVSQQQLLESSDFVSIHVRLSDRTRGLIGPQELARMKSSAYLINTSRGPIVDEHALLEAVRSDELAGAAIDVFDNEPLPVDHPFRREPRIFSTPHIGYVTRQTYEVFYSHAVEDIAAWMDGAPMRLLT